MQVAGSKTSSHTSAVCSESSTFLLSSLRSQRKPPFVVFPDADTDMTGNWCFSGFHSLISSDFEPRVAGDSILFGAYHSAGPPAPCWPLSLSVWPRLEKASTAAAVDSPKFAVSSSEMTASGYLCIAVRSMCCASQSPPREHH